MSIVSFIKNHANSTIRRHNGEPVIADVLSLVKLHPTALEYRSVKKKKKEKKKQKEEKKATRQYPRNTSCFFFIDVPSYTPRISISSPFFHTLDHRRLKSRLHSLLPLFAVPSFLAVAQARRYRRNVIIFARTLVVNPRRRRIFITLDVRGTSSFCQGGSRLSTTLSNVTYYRRDSALEPSRYPL